MSTSSSSSGTSADTSTAISSTSSFSSASPAAPRPDPPEPTKRKGSDELRKALDKIMGPWAERSPAPHQCRAVMYPGWTRFNPKDASTKSAADMKASVLWSQQGKTPGTTADFNAPLFEKIYLGHDQPEPHQVGNPHMRRRVRGERLRLPHLRLPWLALPSSWATIESQSEDEKKHEGGEGITFQKSPVRHAQTTSLLTQSVLASQQRSTPVEVLSKEKGKEMTSEDLVDSAFDSDSEDEDEALAKLAEMQLRRMKMANRC